MHCTECLKPLTDEEREEGICARCGQDAFELARARVMALASEPHCSECKRQLPERSGLPDDRLSALTAMQHGWHPWPNGGWLCPGCALILEAGRAEEIDRAGLPRELWRD